MKHINYNWSGPTDASIRVIEGTDDFKLLRRLPRPDELRCSASAGETTCLGIVDTETTSLDPASGEMIEIGLVQIAIDDHGQIAHVKRAESWLNQPAEPISPEITRITGLTNNDLEGERFDDAAIAESFACCELMVAQNAVFDRGFLVRRYPEVAELPWACTVRDIDWTVHGFEGRSLQHLLFQAGHFFEPHRAADDAWALACLLAAPGTDGRTYAAHLLDFAKKVSVRLFAEQAPYKVKDKLKARGYQWSVPERVWFREVRRADEASEIEWLTDLHHLIRPRSKLVDAYTRHA